MENSDECKTVGILTFHYIENFGAVLQAYALQEVIKKMGYYVEIIDFCPTKITPKSIAYSIIKKLLLRRNFLLRRNRFYLFRKNFMHLSKEKYNSSKELKNKPFAYDVYLVGSDQVWNPRYIKTFGFSYLLDFAPPNAHKISYAASVVEKIPEELIAKYKHYLEQFRYISVREKSSKDILKEFLDREIEVCLDPALLLKAEQWQKIIKEPKQRPYKQFIVVLDYFKTKNLIKLTNRIAREKHLSVVSFSPQIPMKERYINYYGSIYFEGPCEILWYLSNADLILTSSLHGLVFALIFGKNFLCVPDPYRGSRIIDLLAELEIEDDHVLNYNASDEEVKNLEPRNISADSINKLNNLRDRSIRFLKRALKNQNIEKGHDEFNFESSR
ncbi:MAG: polysaccharide pyruvyl transferase family protein [Leptospiraceae bacterium]|nr:polysaccharide pyruvyl transferase family protein [Leptospiraceae bacterium]